MQTKDLTVQDLTIDQFSQLVKALVRETVEDVLHEMFDDDEASLELRPEFMQEILERQRLRREGKTTPVGSEDAMIML